MNLYIYIYEYTSNFISDWLNWDNISWDTSVSNSIHPPPSDYNEVPNCYLISRSLPVKLPSHTSRSSLSKNTHDHFLIFTISRFTSLPPSSCTFLLLSITFSDKSIWSKKKLHTMILISYLLNDAWFGSSKEVNKILYHK